MFAINQNINGWKILLAKRVDETVCNPDLPHGDYYLVQTTPDEHVIVILPIGEESEHALRRAVEKELHFQRSLEGKKIKLFGGYP